VATPTTSSITSRHLVAMLDAAGSAVDDALRAAHVSRAALAKPDVAVPLALFAELWRRAAAVQPDIGLAMVDRFGPGDRHLLVHLALRSRTVGAALDDVCRHASATSSADRMTIAARAGVATFAYACRVAAPPNPWIAEHYLSMAVVFLARASGRALPVRRVRFAAPAQAPLAAYVARFGVAPAFDSGANALDFDAAALDWPLATQDDYLHAILAAVARERATEEPQTTGERARVFIAERLLRGEQVTLADVAAAVGATPRSLRSQLAGEGSSFRTLLDATRRDLARDHLGRGLSTKEVAYLLGFSEPAAFQHACLRWFGRPAGDMRRTLQRARRA
jgi:AraC-like DNA-binding protein